MGRTGARNSPPCAFMSQPRQDRQKCKGLPIKIGLNVAVAAFGRVPPLERIDPAYLFQRAGDKAAGIQGGVPAGINDLRPRIRSRCVCSDYLPRNAGATSAAKRAISSFTWRCGFIPTLK